MGKNLGLVGCATVCTKSEVMLMEEGCKNHREKTLYSSKEKVVYVVRKPCNIYRLEGNPYDNYSFSPKSINITGFPHKINKFSL